MKLLVCYERECGGETIATESIGREFKIQNEIDTKLVCSLRLTRTSSIGFFGWIVFSLMHWLSIVWKHRDVDWIYTTTYTAGLAGWFLKPFSTHKLAWHFHGNRVPPSGKGMSGKTYLTQYLKYYTVLGLHKLFIRYLDIIFVPSEESKKVLLSQFPKARSKKISIIPNGVNLEKYFPVPTEVKKKLRKHFSIPRDWKVLLYIGRIEKLKGIEDLIDVLFRLRKQKYKTILILAHPTLHLETERKYVEIIKKKNDELNLTDSVRWIQNHPNLTTIYQISDLVVSLSKTEHFPLTMLEAWATKTLYISRGVGAVNYFLKNIDSRLIIKSNKVEEMAKSIRSILRLSPQEIRSIQKKGFAKTQNYTWKNSADKIILQMELGQKN